MRGSERGGEAAAETGSAASHRRNSLALVGDFLCFGLGLNFASQATVLPAFVRSLTDSAPLVGLGSTIATGGWLLPQIFAANYVAGRPRKRLAVIYPAIVSRAAFLLLSAVALLVVPLHPGAALALFYLLYFVFWALDGVASVAWLDILGKLLTPQQRARMIGIGQAGAGVLGIGAGLIVSVVLGSPLISYPSNYALLLLLGGVALVLSLVSFLFLREPAEGAAERPLPWTAYFRRLASVLRGDAGFRRLIGVQLLLSTAGLATPFYVIFGLDSLGFSPSTVGVFTSFQVAGGIAAALAFGRLGERHGPRSVMRLWGSLVAVMPLAALGIASLRHLVAPAALPYLYAVVFLAVGAQGNAGMAGFINYVLEHAPPTERTLYVGVANALSGTSLVMPIIGGLLVSLAGYPALFSVAAAVPLAGFVGTLRLAATRRRDDRVDSGTA